MNKKTSPQFVFLCAALSISLCAGLCACTPGRETVSGQESSAQETAGETSSFLECYRRFCEEENAEQIALLYLDDDAVPELLIRGEQEYELYCCDGSEVERIAMPEAEIKANTYGPKHRIEELGRQTPYWFEYVPRQGLLRVHGGEGMERHDYYLRYAEGKLSKELESESGDYGWLTYEADEEISSEEFRSLLSERGYDRLAPCAYLYDSVEAAYQSLHEENLNYDITDDKGTVKKDSRAALEDFVNGRADALCYEDGSGTSTAAGEFFWRNYEEIYASITCGETWWGSLKYVDFDNDGQEELVLGGYTGSRMFFDVIGDTVYEVLRTGSTTDNGCVAERNGRYVIERTDLLHTGRMYYWVTEYDSCCCVVDWFSLRANFEGDRYAEGDEFAYRGREITMEEFEEIVDSIHGISVEDRVLEYWVGEYEFRESVSEPIPMTMDYRIKIDRDDDGYYADIEIDGQTTLARMRAEAGLESGSDRIELLFCEYLPEHRIGGANAEEGEVLLVLERKNGEILTHWGKIVPMLHENEENGKVYFVKKADQ